MKFGKRLRMQVEETLPEWRNQFLSYKELKKRLKSLSAPECFTDALCEASTSPDEDSSLAGLPRGSLRRGPPRGSNDDSPGVVLKIGKSKRFSPPHREQSSEERKGDEEQVTRDSEHVSPQTGGGGKGGEWEGEGEGEGEEQEVTGLLGERRGTMISVDGGGEEGSRSPSPSPEPRISPNGVFVSGLRVSPQASSPALSDDNSQQRWVMDGIYPGEFRFSLRDSPGRPITKDEDEFIRLLNGELEKFNNFFIEKEEEYVIRLQELKERIDAVSVESGGRLVFRGTECTEEIMAIRQEIVSFHGEMVLLENYSSLNYMGLVKILKKHDKRMGTLLRLPFIQTVLNQPFYTTELLGKLVRQCEEKLQLVFPPPSDVEGQASAEEPQGGSFGDNDVPRNAPTEAFNGATEDSGSSSQVARQVGEGEGEGDGEEELVLPRSEDVACIYRSTLAALKTLQEMRGVREVPGAVSRDGEEGNGSGVSSLTKTGGEGRGGREGEVREGEVREGEVREGEVREGEVREGGAREGVAEEEGRLETHRMEEREERVVEGLGTGGEERERERTGEAVGEDFEESENKRRKVERCR